MSRFRQAISEGDGISVVPMLDGDVGGRAEEAAGAGAEALAVGAAEAIRPARERSSLPVILRAGVSDVAALERAREAGADACVLVYEQVAGEERLLEELHAAALRLGLDVALDVQDEEELERALERVDPDIVILSERDPEKGEEELERTLDLLPDVPAGKLVISESRVSAREQVLALERAGVDAVLLPATRAGPDLAELIGR